MSTATYPSQTERSNSPPGTSSSRLNGMRRGQGMHDRPKFKQSNPMVYYSLIQVLCIIVFVCFFVIGVFEDTGVVDQLAYEGVLTLRSFANLVFCWTWGNLVVLCCLASVVGEIGRYTTGKDEPLPNMPGAINRGFFLYLLTMATQLVVIGSPVSPPALAFLQSLTGGEIKMEKEQLKNLQLHLDMLHFFRLAGIASFLSFLIGFNPNFFLFLMKQIETRTEKTISQDEHTVVTNKGEVKTDTKTEVTEKPA